LISNKIYWYKKKNGKELQELQGSNTEITRIKKIKDRREWLVPLGKQSIQKISKEKLLEVRNGSLRIFKTPIISFPLKTSH